MQFLPVMGKKPSEEKAEQQGRLVFSLTSPVYLPPLHLVAALRAQESTTTFYPVDAESINLRQLWRRVSMHHLKTERRDPFALLAFLLGSRFEHHLRWTSPERNPSQTKQSQKQTKTLSDNQMRLKSNP